MSFQKLVRGRADTPFQYRFLVPWLAGMSYRQLAHYHLVETLDEIKALFEFSFVLVLLVVFVYAAPYLVMNDPGANEKKTLAIRILSGSLFMFALPFHFILPPRIYYYPYDIPAILFFIAGLMCMRLKQWPLYLFVFALGTFNRETTIFLSIIYMLTNWKNTPRAKLAMFFLLQISIWLAIKFFLWQAFKLNSAESVWYADVMGIFKNSWDQNLEVLSQPETYPRFLTIYGYLWIPLLLAWSHIRDEWLRSAVWIIPIYHLSMLVPGEINELRIYSEMIPLVVLGIAAGTVTLYEKISNRPKPQTGYNIAQ